MRAGRVWIAGLACLSACSGGVDRIAASTGLRQQWEISSYELTRGDQRLDVEFFNEQAASIGTLQAWLNARERVLLLEINGARVVHQDDGTQKTSALPIQEGTMTAGNVPLAGVILLEAPIQEALASEVGLSIFIESSQPR